MSGPEPFDPMADLAAHIEPLIKPPEPPADGAPFPFVIDMSALFDGAPQNVARELLGTVTLKVQGDDELTIFDTAEESGGTNMQLSSILVSRALQPPGDPLPGDRVALHLVKTRRGWFAVVAVDFDDDAKPTRVGVVSMTSLVHRVWHAISGTECPSGMVQLAPKPEPEP